MDIADTYLCNEMFNIIKNSQRLNHPIDYQKFISFIAVLSKGSRIEKLLLIFSIFGKGVSPGLLKSIKKQLKNHESEASVNDDTGSQGSAGNQMFNVQGELNNFEDNEMESRIDLDDTDAGDMSHYVPRITKEDMKIHISGTILSMVKIDFLDGNVETLKQSIVRAEESLIDDALDMLVEEIYDKYAVSNKDEGLTFQEWCDWFTSLEGVNEMLLSPSQIQQQE